MKTLYCGVFLFVVVRAMFAQQAITVKESPFQAILPEPTATDALAFSTPVPDFEARDLGTR